MSGKPSIPFWSSLCLQNSFDAIWHGFDEGAAVFFCNFLWPNDLKLLNEVLFTCRMQVAHFFLHNCPTMLDWIQVRWWSGQSVQQSDSFRIHPSFDDLSLVARGPILLENGAMPQTYPRRKLFFQNRKVNSRINRCACRHNPERSAAISRNSTPKHDGLGVLHSSDAISWVITLSKRATNRSDMGAVFRYGTLIRKHDLVPVFFRLIIVETAKR